MFHARRLAQSPFWLASSAILTAGWVVSLIGCIMSPTPAFIYWTLAFHALTLLTTLYIIGSGSIYRYRLALLSLHSISFIYSTLAASAKIHLPAAEDTLAGIGFCFTSAMLFTWIFALGTDDSRALVSVASSSSRRKVAQFNGALSAAAVSAQRSPSGGFVYSPQLVATHQRSPNCMANAPSSMLGGISRPHSTAVSNASSTSIGHGMDIGRDVEYMYKGQALYAYTASPDDPNELSFGKGEMLDIVDNKGKWWQARKTDGSIGIVPSNYVKLL